MAAVDGDMNYPPMDHAWFAAHPFGIAVRDWLEFMGRVIAFNDLAHLSIVALRPTIAITTAVGTLFKKLGDEHKTAANRHIAWASQEIDSDFELMHALILVAAWGSFEAFVDDVCKALLAMDRSLLTSEPFRSVKIPASVVAADPIEQIDLIFTEATKKLSTDLGAGIGKFEPLLKLVGLDGNGDISDELRNAIFYAQQTRNVWTHRAGKADKKFLKHCGHMKFGLGDTVKISTDQTNTYLRALTVYGVLVVNRFLGVHNISPMPFPGDGNSPFADPYARRWGTMPNDEPVTGWFEDAKPSDPDVPQADG